MSRKIYLHYILTDNIRHYKIHQNHNVYVKLLISGGLNTYQLDVINGEIQHTISQHKLNRDWFNNFLKSEPRGR